ncbi:putative translation initiation factor eIF-2B subunit delta [Triangularia verruculosa]|uniref:Translation initiation factor eIF2B subunit delta n=1 Tax=Triangularia verruculosa TaxID=2587418 RepID=A0AAN6XTT5_9PEZI|nr:putative translation initiation factor eIF-2B subunit delta [Triangularia verruculosa]
MATESNGAPAGAPVPKETKTSAPAPAEGPVAGPAAAATNPEKLTPAQLKAKAKAEKAARRQKVIANKEAVAAAAPAKEAGKGKGKQDGQPAQSKQHRGSMSGRRPSIGGLVEKEKDVRSGIPECFSHVPMAKRVPLSQAHKDVDPAVLVAGQQMATFAIKDSISRLEATLLAFKKVIESYETPKGNSLSRHLVPHVLNPQIEHLTECRPMCFAMGNAIRLLKTKINSFDINDPEDETKEELLEWIDTMINERIKLAEYLIARNAAGLIEEGEKVLTYGRHRLVEKTLLKAKEIGKTFDVTIIDDPYEGGGQTLAKTLRQAGINVLYSPNLGGLRPKVAGATNVILGGEAIFANGSLNAASGTADVAMAGQNAGAKVTVLCETINFDRERVSVDALTYNEIDPERNTAECFRLLYDNTQDKYISGVVTEFESGGGNSPAQAILALLRTREDPQIA